MSCFPKFYAFKSFLRYPILALFFTLFSLLPSGNLLWAQVEQLSAWQLILNNDFKTAKRVFKNNLELNPNDENALCGLIFIAETTQDYASYKKYIKLLIEIGNNQEQYLSLFGHLYERKPEVILKMNVPEALKVGDRLALADSIFAKRRFEESKKILRSVIGDYEWSVIGPFENVSGSGFLEEPVVEQSDFHLDSVYYNESGFELKWNKRLFRDPNGIINFHAVLPANEEGCYYANTFLEIPDDRNLQFRVARSAPMKIWLDNDLVFQQNGNIYYNWGL